MAKDIGAQVKLEGEKEYKDALNQIDKQIIALKGDYKAVSASVDGYTSAMQSNHAKHQQLNTQLDAQTEKLKLLKDQLSKVQTAEGDHTAEESKLRAEIGYTSQEVKKLRDAYMEIPNALETVGSKVSTFGSKMSSVGSTLTASVTTPIIGLAAYAFKSASDLEENINKVDVSFGDSAQSVKDWAKTATDSFGLSESKALEATSLFGDMATSMGISDDAAAGMSTSLAGLAGDLASFKNISQDQAMNALQGIFTGQTKALKGLGIVMTDTNLKDFAEKQGLVYDKMSDSEKVTLRYQYVLEHTKNAQGDYQRTASGAANSIRTMQASVSNLADAFGEKLLPTFTPEIQKLTELIKKFASLSDSEQQSIIKTLAFAAAIGPVAKVVGDLNEKAIGPAITKIGTFSKTLSSGQGVAQAFVNIGLNPMALAIGATVAAFGLMAAGGKIMQDQIKAQMEATYGLTDEMKANIDATNQMAESQDKLATSSKNAATEVSSQYGYYQSLVEQYNNLIDANGQVKAGYEDRANYILSTLSEAMGMEDGQIQTLIGDDGKLSAAITDVINKKKAAAIQDAYTEQYTDAIKNQAQAQKQYAADLQDYITAKNTAAEADKNYNAALQEETYDIQNNIPVTQDLKDKIANLSAENGIAQGAAQKTKDAYDQSKQSLIDYNTTISNYEGLGSAILSGDAAQISQAMQDMTNNFQTAETGTKESLDAQTQNLKDAWMNMKSAVDSGSTEITQTEVDAAHDAYTRSAEEYDKLVSASYDAGNDAGNELASGLDDSEPNSTSSADNLSNQAVGALKKDASQEGSDIAGTFEGGIRSGSGSVEDAGSSIASSAKDGAGSVSADDSGWNFAQGFANGIGNGINDVWNAACNLANNAWNAINHTLDEHSPSKKTTKQGVYFGEGLANGILSQKSEVQKAAESLSDVALGEIGNPTIPLSVAQGNQNTSYNTITLQVYGANGQSVNDLADAVMDKLQTIINKKGAVWK